MEAKAAHARPLPPRAGRRRRRGQKRRACRTIPAAAAAAVPGSEAHAARERLLAAAAGTRRGAATPPSARQALDEAIETLCRLGEGQVYTGEDLSAAWRLVWTTEKESLWLLENGGLFGTQAGESYQVHISGLSNAFVSTRAF
mmetsp:Transcript_15117/g.47017  ORF Transcript_15117/g.47017 Transcript_15117/m.47017 type:complete len:143 (-) Transcript_15117:470-898(-)